MPLTSLLLLLRSIEKAACPKALQVLRNVRAASVGASDAPMAPELELAEECVRYSAHFSLVG